MARSRSTWSPEQAREMAARARLKRAHNRADRLALKDPVVAAAAGSASFNDDLLQSTRARIRKLGGSIDVELLRSKVDGATIDRLASALERLAELERRLDGRPLPGTRRPSDKPAPPARPPAATPISAPRPAQVHPAPEPAPPSLTEPPDW